MVASLFLPLYLAGGCVETLCSRPRETTVLNPTEWEDTLFKKDKSAPHKTCSESYRTLAAPYFPLAPPQHFYLV